MKEQIIGIEVLEDPKYKKREERLELAGMPNLSPELIDLLIRDEDWEVRDVIAFCKDLTSEQIERLSQDED